jgi:hypothetical protein
MKAFIVPHLIHILVTDVDMKILDSFNSRSPKTMGKFKSSHLKINGSGDEVCLTGFTSEEKKFGELLANKGFKIRGTVTSNLRILIIPSGSYMRNPSKEAEARRVGAEVIDPNSFVQSL